VEQTFGVLVAEAPNHTKDSNASRY
jgi:hypothetical protein